MPDAPVFTLESANALVPRISAIVSEQIDRRGRIEEKLASLTTHLGDTPERLDPVSEDSQEVAALRAEAKSLIDDYRAGWEELESLGGVVKDPRRGLVDFYGHVEGRLVWLCWKYGEAEVSHYHGLEEGFPGRRAIVQSVKERLLN